MPNITVTKNNYEIESLYQWDLNQTLVISGLSLPVTPEVHFARDGDKLAIVRQATMDAAGIVRVDVPNSLLQKSGRINAYVCITEGETFRSLYKIIIPVIGRAQPSDYEGTDDAEVYSLDALGVEVIVLDPEETATVEKVLREGGWTLRFSIPRGADGAPGAAGKDGKDGADGTVAFDELTDTQKASLKGDKGDPGEKGEKGDKGDPGEPGKDGVVTFEELTEEQKATLKGEKGEKGDAFTYDDFTEEQLAALKGDKGETGETGEAGHTPVKGEDYFTEDDKTAIVNDVLAALPAAEGASF